MQENQQLLAIKKQVTNDVIKSIVFSTSGKR